MPDNEQVTQTTHTNAALNNEIQNAFQIPQLNAARMRSAAANEYYFQASKLGLDICEYIMRFCALVLVNGLMDYLQEHDEEVDTGYVRRDLEPLSIILLNKKLSFGHWELIIKSFFPSSNLADEFDKFRFGKGENANKGYNRSPYAYFYNLLYEVYKILYYGNPEIRIDRGHPHERLLSSIRNDVEGHGVLAFDDQINRGNYEIIESRAALMMQVHKDIINHVTASKIDENNIEITVFDSADNNGRLKIDLASLPPATGNATINAISVLFDSYEKYKKVRSMNFDTGERFDEKQQIDHFNKIYKLLENNPTQVAVDMHFNDKQQYISVIEELNRKINDKLLYNQPLHSYIVEKLSPESDTQVFLLESDKPIGKTVFAKVNNIRGFIDECFVPDGQKKLTTDYVVLSIGFGEYEGKGLLKHSRFVEEIHEQFMCYLPALNILRDPRVDDAKDELKRKNKKNTIEFKKYFEQCLASVDRPIIIIIDNINYWAVNNGKSDIDFHAFIEAINNLNKDNFNKVYCFFFARQDEKLAADFCKHNVKESSLDTTKFEEYITSYVSNNNYFNFVSSMKEEDKQQVRNVLTVLGMNDIGLLHKLAVLWDIRQLKSNIETIQIALLAGDDAAFYIECYIVHLKAIKDISLRQYYDEALKILALLYKTKHAYDIYEISSLCFDDEPSFSILGCLYDISIFLDLEAAEEVRGGVIYSLREVWYKPLSMLIGNDNSNNIAKDFDNTIKWLETSLSQRFADDVERFGNVANLQKRIVSYDSEVNSNEKGKNIFDYLEEDNILCSRYLGDQTEGNQLSLDNEIILADFVLHYVNSGIIEEYNVWQYINRLQNAFTSNFFARSVMPNNNSSYILNIIGQFQRMLLKRNNISLEDMLEIRVEMLLNDMLMFRLFDDFDFEENIQELIDIVKRKRNGITVPKASLSEDITEDIQLFCTFSNLLNTTLSFDYIRLGNVKKVYNKLLELTKSVLNIDELKPLISGFEAAGYKLNANVYEHDLSKTAKMFEAVVVFDYVKIRNDLMSKDINEVNEILKINIQLLHEGERFAFATGNLDLAIKCLKTHFRYIIDWVHDKNLFKDDVLNCLDGTRSCNLEKEFVELKTKIEEVIHPKNILESDDESLSQKAKKEIFIMCFYLKNCLLQYEPAERFSMLQQRLFTVVNVNDTIELISKMLKEGLPETFGIVTLVALEQSRILLEIISGDFKQANELYNNAIGNVTSINSFDKTVNEKLLQEMCDILGAAWIYQILEVQNDPACLSVLPFSVDDEDKIKTVVKRLYDKNRFSCRLLKSILTTEDFSKMLDIIVNSELANGLTFVCAGKVNGRDICKNKIVELMEYGLNVIKELINKYTNSDLLIYYYLRENLKYVNMLQNYKEWEKIEMISHNAINFMKDLMLIEADNNSCKAYKHFFEQEIKYAEQEMGISTWSKFKRSLKKFF